MLPRLLGHVHGHRVRCDQVAATGVLCVDCGRARASSRLHAHWIYPVLHSNIRVARNPGCRGGNILFRPTGKGCFRGETGRGRRTLREAYGGRRDCYSGDVAKSYSGTGGGAGGSGGRCDCRAPHREPFQQSTAGDGRDASVRTGPTDCGPRTSRTASQSIGVSLTVSSGGVQRSERMARL
jgi:hypothetical protein